MKILVCLLLFIGPTFNLNYKKMTIPYCIVISKADLIVDGSVSKVFKNSYEFTITQFVKGRSGSKINVTIWKEWLCDPRMAELKEGQRLILFLEKTPDDHFNPINESTGELYVDKDKFTNIFIAKDFSNPTVLKKGVTMYLETYTYQQNLNGSFFYSQKSIFEIGKMKEDNKFFKFLVDKELAYSNVTYNQINKFNN
ncbi:hypothetical protein [Flavobacterium salmonis]|uniref:Uncharacterized protein n=1 Tax=Flavobacterium salmonis TaxID=2654844 RepID=A0A6V6Z7Y9_9FLAO|nr:hypothetical protein [Flavobacterium salmonis]CAD0007890.1 hypothetical protein FLAT13_04105 [Flavobacterium salmonis]